MVSLRPAWIHIENLSKKYFFKDLNFAISNNIVMFKVSSTQDPGPMSIIHGSVIHMGQAHF